MSKGPERPASAGRLSVVVRAGEVMGVRKENVASCGWGGTLRLRAKVVDARDRGAKTAEKLVGQGLELG